jgi:ParB-like chromosome segregation protein Spo0J
MTGKALGKIQNRIVGSGEEPLDQIQFNPRNWRVHPLNQQNALKGVLEEVGWVQEVIINKRTGNLVDGHLRCQLAAREGAKTIPVKYVDLSEEEEALVLSTLDPIAAMATTDRAKLDDLMRGIQSDNEQVQALVKEIAEKENLLIDGKDGFDFSALPDEDRAPFRQMTFTLHDSQFEQVTEAMRVSKGMGTFEGSLNENSNGNALARICETFITDYGNS